MKKIFLCITFIMYNYCCLGQNTITTLDSISVLFSQNKKVVINRTDVQKIKKEVAVIFSDSNLTNLPLTSVYSMQGVFYRTIIRLKELNQNVLFELAFYLYDIKTTGVEFLEFRDGFLKDLIEVDTKTFFNYLNNNQASIECNNLYGAFEIMSFHRIEELKNAINTNQKAVCVPCLSKIISEVESDNR